MTLASELHFQSPWGISLLVVLPAVLLALFEAQRRRRVAWRQITMGPWAQPERGLKMLLLFSLLGTAAGIISCSWGLVLTTDKPLNSPVLLVGFLLLGLTGFLLAPALWLQGRMRPVLTLSIAGMLPNVSEGKPSWFRFIPPILRLLAFFLLVVVLARPQISTTEADVFAEGMDIVLTLDVSTTMKAVDFSPPSQSQLGMNRIDGAKEVISRFIQQRREDRLGLVVFSAEAFTQCPLTLDYSVIQNILRAVQSGVIEDGTAIGDAIMVSVNRLRDSETKSKVIILLTDGDDNMSRVTPIQAAEIAAEQNIKIFPILVGKGGKVPYPVGTTVFGQVQYQEVEIRTNPELLKKIADITHGKFFRAVDQDSLEKDFQDVLDHMEKTRLMDPGRFTRNTELFQPLLLIALLALLLELALQWTRYRTFP
jgi:Ca-activated chloride channel homolog